MGSSTNAFLPQNIFVTNSNNAAAKLQLQAVTTAIEVAPLQSDKHAEAFTAYMTKSHEEKLKAIKVVEDNRNAEIKDLKKQIVEMEELSIKLEAYQKFMKGYIVNAHEEKFNAVKVAEAAISKKYEGKLNAFMLKAADSNSIAISV